MGEMLGGADIGSFVSILVSGPVYTAMLILRPEPAYLFGPNGAVFGMSHGAGEKAFPPAVQAEG